MQCSKYNDNKDKWTPYLSPEPHKVCSLVCKNDAGTSIKVMEQRVKDGTPCKPGTKDMCLAGQCRAVGCDGNLNSDTVEDQCGVCRGDGTSCTIVEETFKKNGRGYVKIATIPKGSAKISVAELKPTGNTLALKTADGKKFYLNGDYREESDQELHVAGSIGYYFHPEADEEKIIIAGPITSNLLLYACFFGDPNPGITYKYAKPTDKHKSSYVPKYHWEFVDWETCDRRCGGGTQVSEPKCIEEKHGAVSRSFCQLPDKPKVQTRPCNEQPCKASWKAGEWGPCIGCLFKSGYRNRTVECIRESPFEDEEIITDDADCTGSKPTGTEECKSTQPCEDDKGERRDTRSGGPKKGSIVKDFPPPHQFHLVEVPVVETKNEKLLSDEASEALGDKIEETVNVKRTKPNARVKAERQIKEGHREVNRRKGGHYRKNPD